MPSISSRSKPTIADIWETLEDIVGRFANLGIGVGTAKGVTAEARWYDGLGQRPCTDLDLFLAPHDLGRAREAVAELQPDHPLLDHIQLLSDRGIWQTVDIKMPNEIWVDLHMDILKWELPSRQIETIWDRTVALPLLSGVKVQVPDPEMSLILALINLNRDRFRRLIHLVDVVRICETNDLDWDFIAAFLQAEGLDVHLFRTLDVTMETLALPPPAHPDPRGWRVPLWNILWREHKRLPGDDYLDSSTRTYWWIPLTVRGRLRDAIRWLWQRVVPPRELVDHYYPETTGPYSWRLLLGRVRKWRTHRDPA